MKRMRFLMKTHYCVRGLNNVMGPSNGGRIGQRAGEKHFQKSPI